MDETPDNAKMAEKLQALATTLLAKRKEAIEGRAASGVERRWREDEKAFDGLEMNQQQSMIDYATGEAIRPNSQEPRRSKVAINIIRGKCETTHGRFADKILPVDDRNWGLKLTPIPDVVKALKDDEPVTMGGQPLQNKEGGQLVVSDLAKNEIKLAEEAMKGMESEIDDQLTECSFNGECRKVAADAVKAGTGVLKGPSVIKRVKRVWMPQTADGKTVHVMRAKEEFKPVSKRVNYWDVYPDPNCGDDPQRGAYIWEKDAVLPRDVRMLIGVPGYFEDELRKVLLEEPVRHTVALNKANQHEAIANTVSRGAPYERWEYNGELSRDDLEALGCDCSHDMDSKTLGAVVVFINDRPVKVELNLIDTGGLPYDFFQWTQVSDSCWGIGIPRMELWPSRVMNAAWRQMMDNGGDSAGANLVIGDGIEPDDGNYEVTGKKLWRASDDVDVQKQIYQFQPLNNQQDYERVIEMALRFADLESSVPSLFQGEKEDVPDTLGATKIMVDSSNVAFHIRVKRWDDQITRPHLGRYYDWNMQYNPKSEIKGDYCVDPRGASELFLMDQQAPVLTQLLSMKQHPDVDLYTDWEKVITQLFRAYRINAMKTPEAVAEEKKRRKEAPPPVAPVIEAAKIRAESAKEVASIKGDVDLKKDASDTDRDMVYVEAETERTRLEHEGRMTELNTRRELAMLDYATKRGIALDEVKKELATTTMKIKSVERLAAQGAAANQMPKPPIEPKGRAPAGQSYQR
jgi:hypothetical protein